MSLLNLWSICWMKNSNTHLNTWVTLNLMDKEHQESTLEWEKSQQAKCCKKLQWGTSTSTSTSSWTWTTERTAQLGSISGLQIASTCLHRQNKWQSITKESKLEYFTLDLSAFKGSEGWGEAAASGKRQEAGCFETHFIHLFIWWRWRWFWCA